MFMLVCTDLSEWNRAVQCETSQRHYIPSGAQSAVHTTGPTGGRCIFEGKSKTG